VKKIALVFIFLLVSYALLAGLLTKSMQQRQSLVKLGYVPNGKLVEAIAGDQKLGVAALYTLKSIIYYGELVQQWQQGNRQTPELANLFRFLESSVRLDPYNMDSYYFAQAAFTWEVGHAADVNRLFAYGMKFRDWDWLLPYYAGFNSAYFLHDYATAATYMQKAAELSGNRLLTGLTSRYLQSSGQTKLAIGFLDHMIDQSRDRDMTAQLTVRKDALQAIAVIENSVLKYKKKYHHLPSSLDDVVTSGLLLIVPDDPYGGTFYLTNDGTVKTTSKLTFSKEKMENDTGN